MLVVTSVCRASAAGLVLLLLAGCQQDEITRYRAPRIEKPQNRLLGAIIPHGEKTWFVKLAGPDKTVADQQTSFRAFVSSIRFPDKGELPVTWKAPEGWRPVKSDKPGRFATLHAGPEDHPLEVTVTALGNEGQAASVLANVNRWRGQLGLRPVREEGLAKVTQQVKLDGATATLVDLTGSGLGQMALQAQPVEERPKAGRRGPSQPALTYTTPPGWKELPAKGFRVAAFAVDDGDRHAEVTVIPLQGQAGSLLDNVNRWRNELKLPPSDEAQLQKEVRHLKVAGTDAAYVDLAAEAGGKRTLAVMAVRAGKTWFFKMHGADDLVGRQKAAFESFVASVRLLGGAGE